MSRSEISGCPVGLHLAILPNRTHGWTALMAPTQRDKFPNFAKRFDVLLAHLRELRSGERLNYHSGAL